MIIKLEEIEKTEHYIKYKVADTELILEAFENYKKENNLTEITREDKIKILTDLGYNDKEINIILQQEYLR